MFKKNDYVWTKFRFKKKVLSVKKVSAEVWNRVKSLKVWSVYTEFETKQTKVITKLLNAGTSSTETTRRLITE